MKKILFVVLIGIVFLTMEHIAKAEDKIKRDKYTEASTLLFHKNYKEAIQLYKEFIAENPESEGLPDAYRNMASAYILLDDLKKAYQVFLELGRWGAREKELKNPEEYALYNFALYLKILKRPEDSLKYFKKYLKQYPDGEYSADAKEAINRVIPIVEEVKAYKQESAKIMKVIETWQKAYETEDINLLKSCFAKSTKTYPSLDKVIAFWKEYDVKIKISDVGINIKNDKAQVSIRTIMITNPLDKEKSGEGEGSVDLIKENGEWRIVTSY